MAKKGLTAKQRKQVDKEVKFATDKLEREDRARRAETDRRRDELEKWSATLTKRSDERAKREDELDKRERELEQKAGFARVGEAQQTLLTEMIKMGQQAARSADPFSHVLRHKGVTMMMTPYGPMPMCGPF